MARGLSRFALTAIIFMVACAGRDRLSQQSTFVDAVPETDTATQAPRGDLMARSEEAVAEPLKVVLPAYTVPPKLGERLRQKYPDYVPPTQADFKVADQRMEVDAKSATMTFSGILRIAGRADEALELSCHFDVTQAPWSCADMYPTDASTAKQRRLQAVANCMGNYMDGRTGLYKCRYLGVRLYVLINGKTRSQLFQREPFQVWRASSGDAQDDVTALPKSTKPQLDKTPPAIPQPKVDQKPTLPPMQPKFTDRLPQDPEAQESGLSEVQNSGEGSEVERLEEPGPTREPVIEEDEFEQAIEDPNASVEVTAPMPVPAPAVGKYSIPGVEKLVPTIGSSVTEQAIGYHHDGNLRNATLLPMKGAGFKCRMDDDRNWGTNLMIDMIEKSAAAVDTKFPHRPPIVIANIAARRGGPLRSAGGSLHKSHQTGLDADIVFPATTPHTQMWNACRTASAKGATVCAKQSSFSSDFDEARFWLLIKEFTCAENHPVIAMFLDKEIKRHMCEYARNIGEDLRPGSCAFKALQALKHEAGHYNHVHVRLRCPGNQYCRNSPVSLASSTGCP